MKKRHVVAILIIMGLSALVVFLLRQEKPSPSPTLQPSGDFTVTGVLRTSGLSAEEATRLDLENVTYQVTDFTHANDIPQGYFLLSRDIDHKLLGRCVRLSAQNPRQESGQEFSYNRSAVMPVSIQEVPDTECSPYSAPTVTIPEGAQKVTLRGTLDHSTRPAPDIGYDYQLTLTEPLQDEELTGTPEPVTSLSIAPSTDELWHTITTSLTKDVEIEGYMLWGYAESKYLYVERVRPM